MDGEQQLSLFESAELKSVELIMTFEIGDRVQITIPEYKQRDTESFFYLQDFLNKRGTVLKVLEHLKIQYEVEVENKIAIVYHDELIIGWPI
ncbi:hypothetical protein V6B14_22490 (plasmid) [Sporosarcina psychrophila]|uniref:hypothetical protein n=1 Tax=Sporosarcina psychrophila TaxID=1476 RepID=UPI0030CF63A2